VSTTTTTLMLTCELSAHRDVARLARLRLVHRDQRKEARGVRRQQDVADSRRDSKRELLQLRLARHRGAEQQVLE